MSDSIRQDRNNKEKVLITGASGQLGTDVVKQFKRLGYEVHGLTRQELDITNQDQVYRVFQSLQPHIVVHCAAYTKVDQAESSVDEAFLINAYGTRSIAMASELCKAKLVYISTDYVFDGMAIKPYHEFSPTNPMGVYGSSKLAGEEFVKQFHSRWFIVRTSWVFGHYGNNFVKTMLALAQTKDSLTVVNDQFGSPTYTVDLAETIGRIIETTNYGTFHVSNTGHCSWYDFARAIFKRANVTIRVIPVLTGEFPRPAKRPNYSVMDHMALRLNGISELRHWEEALNSYLNDSSE